MIRAAFRAILFLPVLVVSHTAYLQAQPAPEAIARVILSTGDVDAISPSGDSRALERGSFLFSQETVITGASSYVQIRLRDSMLIAFQANTLFTFNEYAYDGSGGAGDSAIMTLLRGGFRTISGTIGENGADEYLIETPLSAIAIRGTTHSAFYDPLDNVLYTGVEDGGTRIFNNFGSIDLGLGADYDYSETRGGQAPVGLLAPPAQLIDIPIDENAAAQVAAGGFNAPAGTVALQDADAPNAILPALSQLTAMAAINGDDGDSLINPYQDTRELLGVQTLASLRSESLDPESNAAITASPTDNTGLAEGDVTDSPLTEEAGSVDGSLTGLADTVQDATDEDSSEILEEEQNAVDDALTDLADTTEDAVEDTSGDILEEDVVDSTEDTLTDLADNTGDAVEETSGDILEEDIVDSTDLVDTAGDTVEETTSSGDAPAGETTEETITSTEDSVDGTLIEDGAAIEEDSVLGTTSLLLAKSSSGWNKTSPSMIRLGDEEQDDGAYLGEFSIPDGATVYSLDEQFGVSWGYWNADSTILSGTNDSGALTPWNELIYWANVLPADMEALRELSAKWTFSTPTGLEYFIGGSEVAALSALQMDFDVDLASGRISQGSFRAEVGGGRQVWRLNFNGQVRGHSAEMNGFSNTAVGSAVGMRATPIEGSIKGIFTGDSSSNAAFTSGFSLQSGDGANLDGLGLLRGSPL